MQHVQLLFLWKVSKNAGKEDSKRLQQRNCKTWLNCWEMCYLTTLYFDIVSIVDEWNVSVDRRWKTEVLGENLVPLSLYPSRQRKKNIPVCICVYIYIYMCVCVFMYVCVHVYIYIYIFLYMHMYVYVHIHMYICRYTHVCMYIYIYIYSLNTFEFGIHCQQLQIHKTWHSKVHFIILLPDIH